MRTAEIGQSFNKNLLSTGTLVTEKATYLQNETEGMPNGGKITQRACIPTLDARRCGLTRRTQSRCGHGTQGECDLLCSFYPFHFDVGKIEKNDHGMFLNPRKSSEKAKKCS